ADVDRSDPAVDLPQLEEVAGASSRVPDMDRVLQSCLFPVGGHPAAEEAALRRVLKADQEDIAAMAAMQERLKQYLERSDERTAMLREALSGRREITQLKARLFSTINEAKFAVAMKEQEVEKTARLNQELTQSLADLIQGKYPCR
ncbi:unnamed protein product, partial [Urochloa humidicola]